ncbi:MAG: Mrp/NBP35 family ATP-binding protein, partial [Lachnospiraceae bacterium]|nr:Mrp/NBP35 family ATP-binding protein [Lachnospiraceae bacterium]
IKKIIGISSGKGGVGKSFVTSLLAAGLQKKGHKVGILDADILGPSIPKSFGIIDRFLVANDSGLMVPKETPNGIKIMSSNLLLQEDSEPIIYRGSLIAGLLQQFYSESNWGELDYLFIDMPPGTGDVPLTTYQSIPIDQVIIVASPQELVSMIVKKSINMAKMMNIPIFGIVENMSYVECPKCNEKIEIFGHSDIDNVAKENNTTVLAKIPLRVDYPKFVDEGRVEELEIPEISNAINKLSELSK